MSLTWSRRKGIPLSGQRYGYVIKFETKEDLERIVGRCMALYDFKWVGLQIDAFYKECNLWFLDTKSSAGFYEAFMAEAEQTN